jgi:hypothetical protein
MAELKIGRAKTGLSDYRTSSIRANNFDITLFAENGDEIEINSRHNHGYAVTFSKRKLNKLM